MADNRTISNNEDSSESENETGELAGVFLCEFCIPICQFSENLETLENQR
jgi:hypothetical protein